MKLILCLLFVPICSFSQVNTLTTTKEYYSDNKIRRIITMDDDLNVVSEVYYLNSNSLPVAKINYNSKNSIKSVVFFSERWR